jgi:hypothetical protein
MGLGATEGTRGEVQQGANGLAIAIHDEFVKEVPVEADVIAAGHADGNPSR